MPMKQKKSVAILIFARSPLAESRQKRLVSGSQIRNVRAFEKLNQRISETVQKTDLPCFHLDENNQTGQTFEERYRNAFQFVFDQGFDQVISVGNDTPAYTESDLWMTVHQLRESDVVYGITQKGGIYTLGLSRKGFKAIAFEALPWCQNTLSEALKKYLADNKIKKSLLNNCLQEFNSKSDILRAWKEAGKDHQIARLIRNIFHFIQNRAVKSFDHIFWKGQVYFPKISQRGPPNISQT